MCYNGSPINNIIFNSIIYKVRLFSTRPSPLAYKTFANYTNKQI